MDIMEMTRELGKALQQDDRYTAYMLAKKANDDDKELLKCEGLPILFLTDASLREFAEESKGKVADKFIDMSVSNSEGAKIVVDDSKYAFIDTDEGRYVCNSADLVGMLA